MARRAERPPHPLDPRPHSGAIAASSAIKSVVRARAIHERTSPVVHPHPASLRYLFMSAPARVRPLKALCSEPWSKPRPAANRLHKKLLLDLLDPSNCPAIQSTTTLTLLCALLDQPSNLRAFENLDGLLTVTSLFKQRSTGREVKVKLIEFFYFYLMPEATPAPSLSPPTATASTDATGRGPGGAEPRGGLARANSSAAGGAGGPGHYGINKSPSKHSRAQSQIQIQIRTQAQSQPQAQPQKPPELPRRSQTSSQNQSQNPVDPPRPKGTKTTSEKQALLSRYLSNVDALIEDLRGSAPFGVSAPLA